MIGRRSIAYRLGALALVLLFAATLVGCGSQVQPIRIGAVFPISGNAASLAGPELTGVQIAADLINADGGIVGRPIELVVRDLRSRDEADGVMADLAGQGIEVVIGAYSSDLSIAASEAADRAGLLYWEAGAVADRLTGRGLPMVFRVGTTGGTLGANSSLFAARELAGRLGKDASELRIALAVADDEYARTVADAAESTAVDLGMPVVTRASYNLYLPDWPAVMAELKAARPDVIILASHIPDGIAFRQEMLNAGFKVGALIGSTMAECDPDFAGELGEDAIGIFASDRPTAGFQPSALAPEAAATYARFEPKWRDAAKGGAGDGTGGSGDGSGGYGGAATTTPSTRSTGPARTRPPRSPRRRSPDSPRPGRCSTTCFLRRIRRPGSAPKASPPRRERWTCPRARSRTARGCASRPTRRASARTSAPQP